MIDLNSIFCSVPFYEGQVHEKDGNLVLYPCCSAWCNSYDFSDLMLYKDIDKTYNSIKAKKFRKSILDGNYNYCNKHYCSILQGSNSLPTKKDILINKSKEFNIIKEYILNNKLLQCKLKKLHLCYDKSCNYKCPSCRTEKYILTKENNSDLYNKIDEFQTNLINYIHSDNFEFELGLSGSGDPIVSELGKKLIYSLNGKLNDKLTLLLQTNGSLFNKNFWEKIPTLHKKTSIIVSLDAGTKETYEKIRFGGNWINILKNLDFISELYNNNELLWARIDFVCQKDNYNEIPKFIEIAKSLNLYCYFSRLLNWGTYSLDEYNEKNICNINHPEHNKFIEIINKNYKYNKIDWGNINEFRR